MSTSQNLAKGLVRGTVGIAANRAVDAVIGLLMVPFTLHRLGVDAYGLWALLFATITYLNLADLGFSSSINRFFAKAINTGKREDVYTVFTSAFVFMAGFSLFILLAGLSVEHWILGFFPDTREFAGTASWVYRAMLFSLAIGYLTNYSRALLVATSQVDKMAGVQILLALIQAGMIVTVLSLGWGLRGLAGGSAGFAVLRMILFYSVGLRLVDDWRIGIRWFKGETVKELWRFGLIVQTSRIAEMINLQFDRVLIGRVLGVNYVTSYDVGAKAANSVNIVSQVMLYVIEPAATALHTLGDRERFTQLFVRSAKYIAISALPLAAFVNLAAPELLIFWLGSQPDPRMVIALRMLVMAYMATTITQPLRLCARGAGFPGWEASYAVLQAALNVTLSIVLYFLFGLTGVLMGTLLAAFIGQGGLTVRIIRGLDQPVTRFLFNAWIKPGLAILAASLPAFLLMTLFSYPAGDSLRAEVLPSLLATGILFVILLGVFFRLFGVVSGEEIQQVLGYLPFRKKKPE